LFPLQQETAYECSPEARRKAQDIEGFALPQSVQADQQVQRKDLREKEEHAMNANLQLYRVTGEDYTGDAGDPMWLVPARHTNDLGLYLSAEAHAERLHEKDFYLRCNMAERAGVCYLGAMHTGFWNKSRVLDNMFALLHSEISEALEATRKPRLSEKIPPHTQLTEELADAHIRLMDMTFALQLENYSELLHRHQRTRAVAHEYASRSALVRQAKSREHHVPLAEIAGHDLAGLHRLIVDFARMTQESERDPELCTLAAIIWILDTRIRKVAVVMGTSVADFFTAVQAKLLYNTTRPHMHNKLF
jgi:NTP pyrophosphatase (non-canonical NTP hydrolase)